MSTVQAGNVVLVGGHSDVNVTVRANGTEVDVVSGSWMAMNTASGQSVVLTAGQRIFIPSDPSQAAAENMQASVGSFDVGSFPEWWVSPGPLPGFAYPLIALALVGILGWAGITIVDRRRAKVRAKLR